MGDVAIDFREKIKKLEEGTKSLPDATTGEELTKHHFAPGVYLREFFLPQGMYFTSKLHKTHHFLIVASGKTLVVSENGRETIEGPAVITTQPGTKRAVYGIEDTTFFTIHVTEETDLEKLEENIIAKDYSEIDAIEDSKTRKLT
jgi:quercetin dioxygenase-like cupin family protein